MNKINCISAFLLQVAPQHLSQWHGARGIVGSVVPRFLRRRQTCVFKTDKKLQLQWEARSRFSKQCLVLKQHQGWVRLEAGSSRTQGMCTSTSYLLVYLHVSTNVMGRTESRLLYCFTMSNKCAFYYCSIGFEDLGDSVVFSVSC